MILLLIFSSIFSLTKINPEKPSRNGLIKYCIVLYCTFDFFLFRILTIQKAVLSKPGFLLKTKTFNCNS